MAQDQQDRLAFTIPEACQALSISRTHFYQLAKTGQAPAVTKLGSRSIILRTSLDAWLSAHTQSALGV